jgi:hypothetical protein
MRTVVFRSRGTNSRLLLWTQEKLNPEAETMQQERGWEGRENVFIVFIYCAIPCSKTTLGHKNFPYHFINKNVM